MSINFKSPRYIIPAILLPFFLLLFYSYKESFGKPKPVAKGKDSLQYNVADVSDQVKKSTLSDKLDAYRDQYKKADGYTAIGKLEDDTSSSQATPSLYNEKEKRMLDSIRKVVDNKYKRHEPAARSSGTYQGFSNASAPEKNTNGNLQQQRALAEALNRMRQPVKNSAEQRGNSQQNDPMQLFRQQMALIDSMEKAHDPAYKAQQQKKQLADQQAREQVTEKRLSVTKASGSSALFNTILPERHDGLVSAIIDQDITGYAGSRLRIRLLEDMMAGRFLIKQGTYLYAQITGFNGQRVLLTITSIMRADQILPVKLDIYDNDGLAGLYVPASAFRDFTKDLGSDASQGMTLQQSADNNNQMVMSVLAKMFESTTTAVGKLIRQNKAKLKYNTLVYLIDPEELHKRQ